MIGYRRGLDLDGSVVAVTGAASGIGRATALALADRGARPVLLGPPGDALLEAAAACAARGAAALPLTVDVTGADAVAAAARQAVERFGRLDGWVAVPDDTAVTPVGPLQTVPSADLRRQWAVTVLGAVHGAGAALPYMTAQRRGVLVVVSSVVGQVARPYAAADGMSAAALRSMAAALRQELRLGGVRGVAVSTVLVGVDASVIRTATTVVGQLRRPRLEVVAGGPLETVLTHGHALVPGLTEWIVTELAHRKAAS